MTRETAIGSVRRVPLVNRKADKERKRERDWGVRVAVTVTAYQHDEPVCFFLTDSVNQIRWSNQFHGMICAFVSISRYVARGYVAVVVRQ